MLNTLAFLHISWLVVETIHFATIHSPKLLAQSYQTCNIIKLRYDLLKSWILPLQVAQWLQIDFMGQHETFSFIHQHNKPDFLSEVGEICMSRSDLQCCKDITQNLQHFLSYLTNLI